MARAIQCSNGDGELAIVTFTELPDGEIHAYCLGCWVGFCLVVADAAGWVPGPEAGQPAPSTDVDPMESAQAAADAANDEIRAGRDLVAGVAQLPPAPDPLTEHRVKRGAAARRKRQTTEEQPQALRVRPEVAIEGEDT